MRSIKSRRKRYEACDDVVPVVGLDLPCAAGRLGLQSAPSALLRALGFEPRRQEISNTPGGGVAYLVPVVGLDLPCAAGRLGLQSAPSALLRALGFEPQRQEISNTPGWGRCLFGTGGGARTHTVSPPADFESATSTIPSHRHTVEKYISSTAKFQVFSFSFLRFRCR